MQQASSLWKPSGEIIASRKKMCIRDRPNHTGEDFKAVLEKKGAEVPGYLHVFYRKNRMETETSVITEWAENCADAQPE